FWTGIKGKELGLVDHLGDMRSFLKVRYGEKTRLRLISPPRGLFGMRGGSASVSQIGAGAAQALIGTAEERSLWARIGL
ncbi:MAG: S49 family peptidase, partial [Rhizobiaceae bacterium]